MIFLILIGVCALLVVATGWPEKDKVKDMSEPKYEIGTVTVDRAAEVFAEMLVELCPELLGFGGAAKEWENEFRKRLKEQRYNSLKMNKGEIKLP